MGGVFYLELRNFIRSFGFCCFFFWREENGAKVGEGEREQEIRLGMLTLEKNEGKRWKYTSNSMHEVIIYWERRLINCRYKGTNFAKRHLKIFLFLAA